MSIISFRFAVFLLITAIVYFVFPIKKYQWTVLLAASYVFYAFSNVKFFLFILLTTLTSYYAARLMDKIKEQQKKTLVVCNI